MKYKYLIFFLFLSACTSPYAARGIPEIPGIEYTISDVDQAELIISDRVSNNCDYLRNAVLLKAAYVALSHDYDHFDFTEHESESRTKYNSISLSTLHPIKIYLCRGTCPLMYSAEAMSHILVSKFARSTWSEPTASRDQAACYLDKK